MLGFSSLTTSGELERTHHTNTPDAVLISVQVIVGLQDVLPGEELSQYIAD